MWWSLIISLILALVISADCNLNKHPLHSEITGMLKDLPLKSQFKIWTYMFRRPYPLNSEQGLQRYRIFKKNMKMILASNMSGNEFTLGLGPFTDLTFEEFKAGISNEIISKVSPNEKVDTEKEKAKWGKNSSVKDSGSNDWSQIWPHVLDQGESMSCWAFTTTSLLEAANYQRNNVMEYLSPQSLIDCNIDGFHNANCNGGRLHFSLNYLRFNGLAKYADYPYTAKCGRCSFYERNDCSTRNGEARFIIPYVKISEFRACEADFGYPSCTPEDVAEAINVGPYGTSIQILPELQHYQSGILNPTCYKLDHAVTAVQVTTDYIKFRNTWSASWGEAGYCRIKYIKNGTLTACGLANTIYQVLPSSLIYNDEYIN